MLFHANYDGGNGFRMKVLQRVPKDMERPKFAEPFKNSHCAHPEIELYYWVQDPKLGPILMLVGSK